LISRFRCPDTEDFLVMVLSFSPNLEKLTVSATDDSHDRADRGDLCFMPLFPKKIEDEDRDYYEDDDDYVDDFETEDEELLLYFRESFEIENKVFDLEKLQRYRKQRMANKENGLSPLLEIDYQVITTSATRQKLQKMQPLKATKKADRARKRMERMKTLRGNDAAKWIRSPLSPIRDRHWDSKNPY
jgi:hypothetical protein